MVLPVAPLLLRKYAYQLRFACRTLVFTSFGVEPPAVPCDNCCKLQQSSVFNFKSRLAVFASVVPVPCNKCQLIVPFGMAAAAAAGLGPMHSGQSPAIIVTSILSPLTQALACPRLSVESVCTASAISPRTWNGSRSCLGPADFTLNWPIVCNKTCAPFLNISANSSCTGHGSCCCHGPCGRHIVANRPQ